MTTPYRPWGLPLVWLDFETYYCPATGYTLSAMTPEEYIRDARFQVIGLCAILEDGRTFTAKGPDKTKALVHALGLGDMCVVSHNNGGFDGLVLTMHYGVTPGAALCTIDMARPHMPAGQSLSLAALVTLLGLGTKGTEVIDAAGKRFEDFTQAQIEAYINVYCFGDTRLCRALHERLYADYYATPAGHQELDVMSESVLCSIAPNYQFDAAVLEAEVTRLEDLAATREARLMALFGVDASALRTFLGSGKRLATFMDAYMGTRGVELPEGAATRVPMKPSKADPTKQTFAFAKDDEAFVAMADEDAPQYVDDVLADVVLARLGVKSNIRLARTTRMLDIARRGPYGWPITHGGAVTTGRWAASRSAKVNMQNLVSERDPTKPPPAMRVCVKAGQPDHVLVSADSNAVEARWVVWAAGQADAVAMFARQEDIYSHMASSFYRRAVNKRDNPLERQVGKVGVLSCGFTAGAGSIQVQLRKAGCAADLDLAQGLVDTYRQQFYMVPQAWAACKQVLAAYGKGATPGTVLSAGHAPEGRPVISATVTDNGLTVTLLSGRVLYYRDLRWEHIKVKDAMGWAYDGWDEKPDGRVLRTRVSLYPGKLWQNIIQAAACDTIKHAVWLMKRRHGLTLAGNAHDELTYVVPRARGAETLAHLLQCMKTPPPWAATLPLYAEGGVGDNYAES